MITPFFSISQDDEFVFIDVKISHVRFSAQGIEMVVEDELFVFLLSPYYLRLRFPFPCVDDERSHAAYDSKSEAVKIKIPKETKGQFFPDLDLSAKLLARLNNEGTVRDPDTEKAAPKGPLIEELDVSNNLESAQTAASFAEGESHNWEIPQSMPQEEQISVNSAAYGFNGQYSGIVGVSTSNGNDINELGDPETTAASDRIIERLIKENIKFDPEYYAADYIMEKYPSEDDDKLFKEILEWRSPSTKMFMKWYKVQQALPTEEREPVMLVDFSKEEQEKMMNLPRKSYLVDEPQQQQLFGIVVSLLFAYQYDMRETEGEHNIESAWTVGKLTPQMAFLDAQIAFLGHEESFLRAVALTSVRRALSYPLHRNYKVVQKVWEDVYYNLRGGKRMVLKSLLNLKELFRFHDVYYVYDKIWLEDLCAWIISDLVSEGSLRGLAHDLKKEYDSIERHQVTFEKAEEGDDEMVAISLAEVEEMAETAYRNYQAL